MDNSKSPRRQFMDFAPRAKQPRPVQRPERRTVSSTVAGTSVHPRDGVQVQFVAKETAVIDSNPVPHAVARASSRHTMVTPMQPPRHPMPRPLAARPTKPARPTVVPQRPIPQDEFGGFEDFDDLLDFDDTLGVIEDLDAPEPEIKRPVRRATPAMRPTPTKPTPAKSQSALARAEAAKAAHTSRAAQNASPEAPEAPDNAAYVLGGKSPFINLDKVPKRPLGPAKKASLEEVTKKAKNTYARRKSTELRDHVPTMVVDGASKGSNLSLIIAIILTVILGAIVGAVAYLAFFQ